MRLIPLVVVVGPTASGKTRLGIDIALRYGGEVVSADSMQIYNCMDVGTAKPTAAEMRGVPHHMLGIIEPDAGYSVAQYVADAKRVIEEIDARRRLPVLAGGIGLYVQSLVDNIGFAPTVRDDRLRESLSQIAEKEGGQVLLDQLAEFDPETAAILHPNNIGRIVRAIEVYKTTGMTMAAMQERSRQTPQIYTPCMIGLSFADRDILYRRIDERVDAMMAAGLADEVRALTQRGIGRDTTAMQAIGYKELAEALAQTPFSDKALSQAAEAVKLATRHYAKRQMTWFRRDKRINWLEASEPYEKITRRAFALIDNFLMI